MTSKWRLMHGIMRGMKAIRITAIRHGETAWNADARLQGHLDIALNAVGRRQAGRVARAVATYGDVPQTIFSSDLVRACDTARAVAQTTGAPLVLRPGLRERCFGQLQGRTFAEIEAAQPDVAQLWRHRVPDWTPPGPGGESLQAFRQRVLAEVHTLCEATRAPDAPVQAVQTSQTTPTQALPHIVIVTHGGVLDVLYRAATGLGLQDARTWALGNAAINRLLWTPDGGLTLVGWADTQHLQEETRDENVT